MNQKGIIQSEVIQKEENKLLYINPCMWNATDEPICRAGIEIQMQRRDVWTHGAGGRKSGMNWEIGIDMYTQSCAKQIASANLLHITGPARCPWMTQRGDGCGRYGSKSSKKGIYEYKQLNDFILQQKLAYHCKATNSNVFKGIRILSYILNQNHYLYQRFQLLESIFLQPPNTLSRSGWEIVVSLRG